MHRKQETVLQVVTETYELKSHELRSAKQSLESHTHQLLDNHHSGPSSNYHHAVKIQHLLHKIDLLEYLLSLLGFLKKQLQIQKYQHISNTPLLFQLTYLGGQCPHIGRVNTAIHKDHTLRRYCDHHKQPRKILQIGAYHQTEVQFDFTFQQLMNSKGIHTDFVKEVQIIHLNNTGKQPKHRKHHKHHSHHGHRVQQHHQTVQHYSPHVSTQYIHTQPIYPTQTHTSNSWENPFATKKTTTYVPSHIPDYPIPYQPTTSTYPHVPTHPYSGYPQVPKSNQTQPYHSTQPQYYVPTHHYDQVPQYPTSFQVYQPPSKPQVPQHYPREHAKIHTTPQVPIHGHSYQQPIFDVPTTPPLTPPHQPQYHSKTIPEVPLHQTTQYSVIPPTLPNQPSYPTSTLPPPPVPIFPTLPVSNTVTPTIPTMPTAPQHPITATKIVPSHQQQKKVQKQKSSRSSPNTGLQNVSRQCIQIPIYCRQEFMKKK